MNNKDECLDKLYELRFIAGMNVRYHQGLQTWWNLWDKSGRIGVGLLAVATVACEFMEFEGSHQWCQFLAVITAIAAVSMSVIPLDALERFYAEMLREWASLRGSIEDLELEVESLNQHETLPEEIKFRVRRMRERENDLHAKEPYPWKKYLEKCQDAETRSHHGDGGHIAHLVSAQT